MAKAGELCLMPPLRAHFSQLTANDPTSSWQPDSAKNPNFQKPENPVTEADSHIEVATHPGRPGSSTETLWLSTQILRVSLWLVFKPICCFIWRNHFSHSVPAAPKQAWKVVHSSWRLSRVVLCSLSSYRAALSSGNQFKPNMPS